VDRASDYESDVVRRSVHHERTPSQVIVVTPCSYRDRYICDMSLLRTDCDGD